MTEHENKEIAFFGKITAGMTHEMKNVFAIIKESSGLVEDLLHLSRNPSFPREDRIESALRTINEQVHRGVELTSRLNRFAHAPDEAVTDIDLYETLELLTALSSRFARLQNVALEISEPSRPIRIHTQPVTFQMAMFSGIECCLTLMPSGGKIDIRPEHQDGSALVYLQCEIAKGEDTPPIEILPKSEKWKMLQQLAKDLGGSVKLDAAACRITIFPLETIRPTSSP
ncbi:MAG: hypothetical protein JRJ85_06180 [Deltaproteobacteria bacterium]|nr:hypothetical protein [Deltaproteobacteria bacterium]